MDSLDRLIELAFAEDLGGAGDVTTLALVPESARGKGELLAKEPMVLAGSDAFIRAFHALDPSVQVQFSSRDGDALSKGTVAARVSGSLRSLLTAERTALNLIQRTCGIATLSRQASEAVKGTKTKILDTRKTAPGMRELSKQAVRAGGASNHRVGLFDAVLIKDNHIAAVGGSIKAALERAREHAPKLKVEIEVTNLDQLREAIDHGAQIVMLDNMDDAQIQKAVAQANGRVQLEVSGGVTLERLPRLAALGVDFVSMGALTHSARSMDLSLELSAA